MEVWPVTLLALVALTAYDFTLEKGAERSWAMTAAFWVLYSVLLLSLPQCNSGKNSEDEGPDIPYSF